MRTPPVFLRGVEVFAFLYTKGKRQYVARANAYGKIKCIILRQKKTTKKENYAKTSIRKT